MTAWIVDRLPERLWKPGNVHIGYRLHFCVGGGPDGHGVRTVEWDAREIARGRRRFNYEAHGGDGDAMPTEGSDERSGRSIDR